jgi:hypothetical protein
MQQMPQVHMQILQGPNLVIYYVFILLQIANVLSVLVLLSFVVGISTKYSHWYPNELFTQRNVIEEMLQKNIIILFRFIQDFSPTRYTDVAVEKYRLNNYFTFNILPMYF